VRANDFLGWQKCHEPSAEYSSAVYSTSSAEADMDSEVQCEFKVLVLSAMQGMCPFEHDLQPQLSDCIIKMNRNSLPC